MATKMSNERGAVLRIIGFRKTLFRMPAGSERDGWIRAANANLRSAIRAERDAIAKAVRS